MKSVDERIIDMQFNNGQFENGIQTSLKSIDNLRRGLGSLDGSANSLSNLERIGRSFSLAGIADGVDRIAQKFSALSIMGITALQNLSNAAINFGSRIVSSLTIDPISMGFNEYETKMGAIQTILTNTQKTTKTIPKLSATAMRETSAAAISATEEANAEALKQLRKKQDLEVESYQKTSDKELDILVSKHETELNTLQKAQNKELDTYEKLADKELTVLETKYEKDSEALSKSIENEKTLLKEAHQEKLDMYNEEYMSKLKAVDEDRYNKIKAIDDEIKSIKGLTKSEDEAREKAEQQDKLLELQNRINNAATQDDKISAERELTEYKDKLARDQLLKDREELISNLNLSKQTIIDEANTRKEEIKKEYDDKVKTENEQYNIKLENIREEQDNKSKALKQTYLEEKTLMQERQKNEKDLLKEQQSIRMKNLEDTYSKEKKLFSDNQKNQIDSIKERYDVEIEALQKANKVSLAGMKARSIGGSGAVETIETKGSTLEDVNKALAELNDYADKTIYNFAEMTRNVGTFTAAGIDLETSVKSIKGIANLAAGSGSSSQQASVAMYQLSQALAAGSLKLQDWNSVVNAGMGGQLFQNALKKTAKEMGIVVNEAIPFRQSLESGWITTEVLTKTLSKLADDESLIKAATQVKTFTQLFDTMKESVQSGWAVTWENIIGNKDEAAAMLTSVNDVFGAIVGGAADARNAMLGFWSANGGRTAVIEAISNAFEGLQSVLKPIGEAYREIFPAMTGEQLVKFSKALRDLTANFKIGDETADNLKRTFAGFFAILDIGKQAISAVAGGIARLFKILAPGAGSFLGLTAGIGDWLVSLDEAIKKGDIFNKAIQGIADVIEWVADKVGKGITAIIDFFKGFGSADLSGVESFTEKIRIRFEPFSALFEGIGKIFSNTVAILKKVAPLFYKLASMIGNGLISLQEKILGMIDSGNFGSVLDLINTGLFGALILGIRKFVNSMSDVTDGFAGILDGVKDSLKAWQSSLKAGVLLKIAISIGILAASLAVLAAIDSEKLTGALVAITTLFAELFSSMAIFSKIVEGSGFKGMTKIAITMMGVSVAILILSSAMSKLAQLDWQGIAKGLISVGVLMGMLVATTKLLSANTSGMIKGASGFILFAVAINVLASAVEKLGSIDIITLGKGLASVGVIMAELALFMRATDLNKMGITKGAGILLLATAMTVLASAVKKLGEIDLVALAKGLGSMGVILTELALFINATPDAKRVISTATGLVILGAAMLIFASAIEKMGSMSIGEIVKGLITMAGALVIVTAALNFMPKNMILTGAGLVAVATALVILAQALQTMGGMSWAEVAKGLITLAGSLTIIALAMLFMKTALPGAAALLVIAGALAILAPVLKSLGSMSLAEIGKGLLALAGIFVVIGLAGLVLAPITPIILALGVAIALLGVGCLAVGAGLLAFSAGLTALAIAGSAGVVALTAIITALVGLIPYILKKFGEGIIALAVVLGEGAPVLVAAIAKLLVAILDKVIELTPKIVKAAVVLINGFLQAVIEITPKIIEAIFTLLTSLLDAIVVFIPKLVDAGMKIIIGLLKGIADNIGKVVSTAVDIVANFLMAIGKETPRVVDAGFKMMIDFINGLADSIRKNVPILNKAIVNLIDAMLDGFINTASNFVDIGKNIIKGLINGIKAMATKVVDAAKEVVDGAVEGAKDLLGIHSPSTVWESIGMQSDKGFANGLSKFSGLVRTASKDVGKTAVNSLSGAISNMANIVNGDFDMSPTIRPVLDLSDVQAGMKNMFGGDRTISANVKANELADSISMRGIAQTKLSGTTDKTSKETNSIVNSFAGAQFIIREEADIRKVAREIYQLQVAKSRG